MDEMHQIFAYNKYVDQRAAPDGVVRDDLPYSPNLDRIVEQVNSEFNTTYTHGEVYQAISHMARRTDLKERGLRRETEVPLHGPEARAKKTRSRRET